MRAVVYTQEEYTSMRVANDMSHYFFSRHPEYYARILNYQDFRAFDAVPENYNMDLYVLELDRCDETDAGYRIASRLREKGSHCAMSFIVPSESVAVQVTREMFRPSYVFLKEATTEELHTLLHMLLPQIRNQSFMEFIFQYRKWLLNTDKITYIATNGTRTLLVCADMTLESTERLAELERRLPACFVRVDKGCLINTKHLTAVDFTERKAMFEGGCFVYMSRRGAKKLCDILNAGNACGEELACE